MLKLLCGGGVDYIIRVTISCSMRELYITSMLSLWFPVLLGTLCSLRLGSSQCAEDAEGHSLSSPCP